MSKKTTSSCCGRAAAAFLSLAATSVVAGENDTISVTATRIERATQDVSGSIAVIDEEKIESAKMMNIKDAIQGTPGVLIDSKNGGYDVRLIIRGAGQKANYGVREIMVLRDGVPMTDPDSFSRFDYIDTQDIERIEITKGPGSLYGSGAAGGTVQIISKSVFDNEDNNRLKIGGGNLGNRMAHARVGGDLGESMAASITASHRAIDNGWRRWNQFDTSQVSLKHGLMIGESGTLESEISYSEANIQLPGSMNETQFEEFKDSGKQDDNNLPWKHSGRYSTIWFFNSRLEQEWGDFTFKPRIYFNRWDHYHPVTGAINDNPGTDVLGGDLEFAYKHQLWGDSTLVAGITGRSEKTDGSKKYQYADVNMVMVPIAWPPFFRWEIASTNSDKKGTLLSEEDADNSLYGFFLQETMQPADWVTIDLGFRYDEMTFDIQEVEYGEYDWGITNYTMYGAPVYTDTKKIYRLMSPSFGINFALNDNFNVYFSTAQSGQVPSEGEFQNNNGLEAAIHTNYEVGMKGRWDIASFDMAFYHTTVEDDIMSVYNGSTTDFSNAGETKKKGAEFSGSLDLGDYFTVTAGYAYSDYRFVEFSEAVRTGAIVNNVDRSGNRIPYVPEHQYNVGISFSHPSGFKARVQTDTWDEYWMDNANSEKYGGYEFLTSIMLGYEYKAHNLTLNVDNITDKRYAVEAKKSTSGTYSYSAGSPLSAMLTYQYTF